MMKHEIEIEGLPGGWEVIHVDPSNLNEIDPNHPNYNPIAERAVIQYTVHLKKKQHKDTDKMKKHEIEIEGLPKGWDAVAFRAPSTNEYYFEHGVIVRGNTPYAKLIVKKKQPRRIVIEDTGEFRLAMDENEFAQQIPGLHACKIWREVKESDLSLHKSDDKESLRLSVDECRKLLCNLDKDVMRKLQQFLKDK